MYGTSVSKVGTMIKVSPNEIAELIKEAQVAGKPDRLFIVGNRKQVTVSYDGMFLINAKTREIVDDGLFETADVFTPLLS